MTDELHKRLAAPFPLKALGFKPQVVTKDGKRALPVAYIDARDVMNRLDDAVGPENWSDAYQINADNTVTCRLRVRHGGEWVAKEDVGAPSEQPDPTDRVKAAFSDAFKRAAVKWGIGRYLYSLELPWTDIDEYKKFKTVPLVPAWALPQPETLGPKRAEELALLIELSGTNPGDVRAYYKVSALAEIPEENFDILKARFQKKIEDKKGAKP